MTDMNIFISIKLSDGFDEIAFKGLRGVETVEFDLEADYLLFEFFLLRFVLWDDLPYNELREQD